MRDNFDKSTKHCESLGGRIEAIAIFNRDGEEKSRLELKVSSGGNLVFEINSGKLSVRRENEETLPELTFPNIIPPKRPKRSLEGVRI